MIGYRWSMRKHARRTVDLVTAAWSSVLERSVVARYSIESALPRGGRVAAMCGIGSRRKKERKKRLR